MWIPESLVFIVIGFVHGLITLLDPNQKGLEFDAGAHFALLPPIIFYWDMTCTMPLWSNRREIIVLAIAEPLAATAMVTGLILLFDFILKDFVSWPHINLWEALRLAHSFAP